MLSILGYSLTTRAAASVILAAGAWDDPAGVPESIKQYEDALGALAGR